LSAQTVPKKKSDASIFKIFSKVERMKKNHKKHC